jgi:protein-L-isoaspartate(D-aspartate) O-methyltransferase
MVGNEYFETHSVDLVYLYRNALVPLDATEGINNGEPFLHAAWLGAVAWQCRVLYRRWFRLFHRYSFRARTAGRPCASVQNDPGLANAARKNLQPLKGVNVTRGDATKLPMSVFACTNCSLLRPLIRSRFGGLELRRAKSRLDQSGLPADNLVV